MATKCPYCGSTDVRAINVGQRAWATVAGFVAGTVSNVFVKGSGGGTMKRVYKEQCPSRDYICLNDECRRKFSKY